MNEFLEQFLIECRDLVQEGTKNLLALEESPRDKSLIDGVFRGFHTLKGAAGIVDFPAMGRLLHAAEDRLSAVRAGDRTASSELIGDCLACLDQVAQWLGRIEADGGLPATADPAADALLARFSHSGTASPVVAAASGWLESFLSRHRGSHGLARVALRYAPDSDCFFRGEDPFALVTRLPDILALEMTPARPWPPLDAFGPFECNLVMTVLSAGSPEDVAAVLQPVAGQVEIRTLNREHPVAGDALSPEAFAVLEEQVLMVATGETEGFSGRLGSAGKVAVNVLRRAGRDTDVVTLEQALDQSQLDGNAGAFASAVRSLLGQSGEREASGADQQEADEPGAPVSRPTVVRALRVDVERIDALVNLTGELTVAKNAIGHAARLARDGAEPEMLARMLKDQHALLDRLMSELQRSVVSIRVLPLAHVFQRFPRLIREMARDLGKSVRLVTEGETTEADKAIVETLFEPLLHVLRNALDHGIEGADERRAAGKSATARIRLSAVRNGDHVIVEVSDDGRGIDLTKVRGVAARHGVASAEALVEMTDAAAMELIFAPGFSTAAAVTEVSGRGVGLDAVRTAITAIGGSVAVTSQSGLGATVRFTLPFTVMMVRVMTVEVGGQLFGIPIDAMIETVRIPRRQISQLGAAEAVIIRERTVPLIRLAETLDLSRPIDNAETAEARVVVVAVAGQTGALEVDGFGERMDVMLKPMEGLLAGMGGFAGTTVLGDGRVLIVLDLQELLR